VNLPFRRPSKSVDRHRRQFCARRDHRRAVRRQ
jgi:hypothetical protein